MHFIELESCGQKVLINMKNVSSISAAKDRNGKDVTLLVAYKEHYIVSNTYDEIKDMVLKSQGVYTSPVRK